MPWCFKSSSQLHGVWKNSEDRLPSRGALFALSLVIRGQARIFKDLFLPSLLVWDMFHILCLFQMRHMATIEVSPLISYSTSLIQKEK